MLFSIGSTLHWGIRWFFFFLALSLLLVSCGNADDAKSRDQPSAFASTALEELTGAHTRVVWVQDIGAGADPFAQGTSLRLMGFDSRDGRGEHAIMETPGNYSKPFISPRGDRVVYTDRQRNTVMIVNWDGSHPTEVVQGVALAVWLDPTTGNEWLYVGTQPTQDRAPSYHRIDRLRMDDHAVTELVWDQTPVSEDNFQLSIDGHQASGLFPWPDAGVARLPNGGWTRLGRGCWVSLSPDDQNLFWIFDGSHRNVAIHDHGGGGSWQVSINTAPAIDGHEVYHPRWSNHPRFMTMTGPYTVGGGGNKIRGGGKDVSVHVGRFSEDYRAIEAWTRVTDNQWADFYPDVWIASGLQLALAHGQNAGSHDDGLAAQRATMNAMRDASNMQAAEMDVMERDSSKFLEVKARLVDASTIPAVEAIAPYDRALVANKYVVEEIISGGHVPGEILVAHWVIRDNKILDTAKRDVGEVFQMLLEPFGDRPDLEGERLSMDILELTLPMYYDVQSQEPLP